jgi:hypothetical protein
VPGTVIANNVGAETLLTINNPPDGQELGTIQIFPNTELEITVAQSPRYQSSQAPHRIEVKVISGRIRLVLPEESGRSVDLRSHTQHAQFLLWNAGSYSVDVNEQQSQITVRHGKATIVAPQGEKSLEEEQRGAVGEDGIPLGPLSPERDLVTNGDFSRPVEDGWQIIADAAVSGQSAGRVGIASDDDQNTARFVREGTGHARTGITQLINQQLNGFQSIKLLLSGQLNYQSLGICGALGSECPLMIQIDYQDSDGSPRQWVQGFYYWVDPNIGDYPTLCVTCPPPRQQHEQHAQSTQFFYDSPNLIELLARDDKTPAIITSISVYASGHSYDVQVGNIQLLVEE